MKTTTKISGSERLGCPMSDAGARHRKGPRERAHESATRHQPREAERADGASHLQDCPDEHRRRGRVAGVAHDRRQPARQRVEIQEVHEIDDPEDQRGGGPPVPVAYARMEAAASPIAAGQLELSASVTVTFAIAP